MFLRRTETSFSRSSRKSSIASSARSSETEPDTEPVQQSSSSITLNFVPDNDTPAQCAGAQSDSEGAMISGYVHLNTLNDVIVNSLAVNILLDETIVNSAEESCSECSHWTSVIHTTEILDSEPRFLSQGEYRYPVTIHVNGNYPGTCADHQRRLDYELEILCETEDTYKTTYKTPIILNHVCPWRIPDKQVKANTPLLDVVIKVPQYTSPDHTFTAELVIEDRIGADRRDRRLKWEVVHIEWSLLEYVQEVRIPCPKHSEMFRTQKKKALKETNRKIASGLAGAPVGQEPEERDGKRRFAISFKCHTPKMTAHDIKTPRGYNVWHVFAAQVLYSLEEVEDTGMLRMPLFADRYMAVKSLIKVCESNDDGEVRRWDEMVAPSYAELLPSPPPYEPDFAEA